MPGASGPGASTTACTRTTCWARSPTATTPWSVTCPASARSASVTSCAGVRSGARHPLDFASGRTHSARLAGCGAAWQRASFGTKRPGVQISPPRPMKSQVNQHLVACGSRARLLWCPILGAPVAGIPPRAGAMTSTAGAIAGKRLFRATRPRRASGSFFRPCPRTALCTPALPPITARPPGAEMRC
jgi:hypothetical protein